MSREIERLLTPYEKIKDGDYYYNPEFRCWLEYGILGNQDSENIRAQNYPVRRRETIEDEPKWTNVADDLPPMGITCLWSSGPGVARFSATQAWTGYVSYKNNLPKNPRGENPTHWAELPTKIKEFSKPDFFEAFWQTNKPKLLDMNKEAVKLIFEEARKNV